MRELFVYYRIRAGDAAAALAAVHAMQRRLREQHPALVARLLRRADETGAVQTWMETYATDLNREPAGVSPSWQAEIEAQAGVLAPLLDGPRRTEAFVACAS